MAVTPRRALVAGASGLVGGQLLDLLLEDADYTAVTALVRRELPRPHRKLGQRLVDFDRLADGDLPRADDVFCCLGSTMRQAGSKDAFRTVDFTYVERLARLALQHRAKQFLLVSTLGADPRSRVFYNRVKGETEEAVRKLSFEGVHIFRPSLLLGVRREIRPAERLGQLLGAALAFAFVGPLARYRPIAARTVAAAMIRVAKQAGRGVHVYESDRIRQLGR
ncbi:MAG: NAD(P)H-binding protein [Gemmatimonadales bacterium]